MVTLLKAFFILLNVFTALKVSRVGSGCSVWAYRRCPHWRARTEKSREEEKQEKTEEEEN